MAQKVELANWERRNTWHGTLVRSLLHFLGLRKERVGDDWNEWWYRQFGAYRVIPDRLGNAIELGCGPYTNMRLIRIGRQIGTIVCSDPLSFHYARFRGQWLNEAFSQGIVKLDDHAIEDCHYEDGTFELVVMINVLDHVRDAMACLEVATGLTMPGGYLVIGQDVTDEGDAKRTREDIAHPVRIHHEDIESVVLGHFTPMFRKVLGREDGRNPMAHYGTYLFIGRKVVPANPVG